MESLARKFEFKVFNNLEQLPKGLFLALSAPLTEEALETHAGLIPQMLFISDRDDDTSFGMHFEHGCADFLFTPLKSDYLECKIENLCIVARKNYTQAARSRIASQLGTPLTHKEERILVCLLEAGPDGTNRQELNIACWHDASVHSKTLDTHLFNLRRKLEKLRYVIVHSRGVWTLNPPVDQGR